ncbi:MAG: hypothetical protein KKH93_02235 [Candidatus Omnitrophica bacterium]|nr:hypothetical protein [Candidatus Omnitrophota bacterium]MBU2044454.1 hypothetical protein [Candidatus Omnitrophota bacterium]MBU2251577.1 hypothetical protein [Candidatus Omnitrophota bacterium]MBU2265963.1 hypothetical protein [Candidatus Omnitrophota bacterium]MBU2474084.1 hypothetical protein [Candidatus Omnitrophota bacterium]
MGRRLLLVALCLIGCTYLVTASALSGECKTVDNFFVYTDKNSPLNNFIPSGWMGDYGDLRMNDQATDEFVSGATSIKLTYTAKKTQGQGWAGIYWQSAQNNWGAKDTGVDLSKYNKLVLKAKGENGGEVITKMKVGGITKNVATGEAVAFPDSLDVESGPIRLTKDWQEYYINLVDQDLSSVNGGFAVIFNVDHAAGEQAIYLDEVYFTYDPNLKKEEARTNFPFYVYADSNSLDNHFIPSGWMPATAAKDLRLNTSWKNYAFSGDSSIRVEYKNESGTRWAGIYWQQPANNWGEVPNAGYNLQGATKLTFWARGDKGEEIINEFKVGGISSGEHIDSDSASIGPVKLTTEWTKYEIDLTGKDLSYVIGGFCWSTNIDVNDPEGIVFYLDEIAYE